MIIELFNRQLPTYGLSLAVGVTCAILLGWLLTKRHQILFEDFIIVFAYSVLTGLIGAKLLYFFINVSVINWKLFFHNKEYFLQHMAGGLVFYGGAIGGLLGILACNRIHRIDTVKILSLTIPTLPLAHAFGRVGCHLAGCCYGLPVSKDYWHVIYDYVFHEMQGVALFPVQLIESLFNFLIAGLLMYYVYKLGATRRAIYLYGILYSIVRFNLEFFRYDISRGVYGPFSTSQYISLAIFLIATYRFNQTDWSTEIFSSDLPRDK